MASDSRLLPEDLIERIVRLCRTTMGDSLRSVTYFTRDDYDQLYLRSDLARDADLSTFVGYEWRDFKTTRDAYLDSELGDYRYTIRAFDNGYLLRVTTQHDGVFVTADEVGDSGFEEFAAALTRTLTER
jgi:phage FluMu gp28-like protein